MRRPPSCVMLLGTHSSPVLHLDCCPLRRRRAPDLDGLTAQQAAADLCASKFTSKALVSAAMARAKANPNLNAFITLDEAGAMKAAAAFDAGQRKTERLQAARRRAHRHQGQYRGRRPALVGRHAGPEGICAEEGCAGGRKSCARPAPSSSARPTCTSSPSAFPATTAPSRPARSPASATPMTRRRSRAARRPARRPRSARGSSPRVSAPTPAARCGSPAR